MSRRCKPGQRARVISRSNYGTIVVVVRHYFGEEFEGGFWPRPLFPWVVASLGRPLQWKGLDGNPARGTSMAIVLDDSDLEPIVDDDDADTRSTELDKPLNRPLVREMGHA